MHYLLVIATLFFTATAGAFDKVFTNDQTSTAVLTVAPTATAPSTTTNGVISVSRFNAEYRFLFYGTDAANETATAHLYRWYGHDDDADGTPDLWIPVLQGVYTITLGTTTGVSGQTVTDTQFFADTIAITGGTGDDQVVHTNAQNAVAELRVSARGSGYLQLTLQAGTAATANAMVRSYGPDSIIP